MTDQGTSGRRPWVLLAYTALRVAIFGLAWLLIVLITPLQGLGAVVMAVLVSGIVSIPLLSRQRDALSGGVFGFFRSMNERIDASARAEDDSDETPPAAGPSGER